MHTVSQELTPIERPLFNERFFADQVLVALEPGFLTKAEEKLYAQGFTLKGIFRERIRDLDRKVAQDSTEVCFYYTQHVMYLKPITPDEGLIAPECTSAIVVQTPTQRVLGEVTFWRNVLSPVIPPGTRYRWEAGGERQRTPIFHIIPPLLTR